MSIAHTEYSPYNYTFNNPILLIDPMGLDTFNINIDNRSVNRVSVKDSKSHTYIIKQENEVVVTYNLDIAESGLVKFPASGQGFNRYGTEDAGGTEIANDGTQTSTGPGDHYLTADAAAALFGLSREMDSKPGGASIDYGDMSNELGQAPWQPGSIRHTSHGGLSGNNTSGICIDYRYLDGSNRSFWGEATDKRFNVISNYVFLNIAGKWGFNTNYVSNQDVWKLGPAKATPNATLRSDHLNHGHLTYTK